MDNTSKKRIVKSSITIAVIIALAIGMLFTTGLVGSAGPDQPMAGGQPSQQMELPDGQQPPDQNGSSGQSGDTDQQGQPPELPDGQQKPDDQQKPDGQQPPDQNGSSGQSGDTDQQGQPPELPDGQSTGMKILTGAEALAIALLLVYLLMSGFYGKSFKETMPNKRKIAAFAVASVLIAGALTAAGIVIPQHAKGGADGPPQMEQTTGQIDATGAVTVDGENKTLNDTYESETADENAILVTGGGTLESDGAVINKKSGDGSNTDSCDFHGVNAGLLVNDDSKATVKNATIKTSANRSNGVFCTGEKAKIEISDSTIETTGESSCRGLDATDGGTIIADKMKIKTQGGSCAALATDRGEGTVTVTNSEMETNGAGSPVIYSTGDISIENSKGTARGSQIAVVEGKNSATIENSTVTATAAGNRGDTDVCGVMLYQSMSGDASEGTAEFKSIGSTLSIDSDSQYYETAPMFFVTNTDSVIRLTDTELNYGSGKLLSVKATDEWGSEGSNGGTVKLIAKDQTLKGDIEVDEISEASIYLTQGSSYKGAINSDNKAKAITLKISENSKLTLTGDTYVTALDDKDSDYSNIDFNGYKLYVDGKAIN